MKTIARAWSSISLVKRIIIGLIIGALLGVFAPTGIGIIASPVEPSCLCS